MNETTAPPDQDPADPQPTPFGPPPFQIPAPPSLPRRHRGLRRLGAAAAVLAVGAGTGAAVAAVRTQPPASVATTQLPGGSSSAGSGSSGSGSSTSGSGTNGSGSSSSSGTSGTASVDAAVVDIDGTLATGGEVAGTGMVISSSGDILTNNHVIEGTSSLTVQIDGTGRTYAATVVGTDATADIAVIKIDASGLRTISLGDSSTVSVGEAVTAIGNALGQGGTPSSNGSVVALNQTITAADETAAPETLTNTIEINAFIEPGDSGGPLVDSSGKVIGIITAALSSGASETSGSNQGYAIPINTALTIAHEIEAGTASPTVEIGTRGVLGVEVAGSSAANGAAVAGVQANSPAAAAGIAAGDVITSINGTAVTSVSSLSSAMSGMHPGQSVRVSWTDASGAAHSATVQLESGPPA